MVGNITILNKLNHKDSLTGQDVWYKTFLNDIKYKQDKVTSVVGTDVSMGQMYTILIPFNEKYKSYPEWKTLASKENFYTISQGDYIILGQHIADEITPNTVVKVKTKYEPNVCEVRSIEEVPMDSKKYGIKIQLRIGGV